MSLSWQNQKSLNDIVALRGLLGCTGLIIVGGFVTPVVELPLNPIFAEQLHRMLCTNRAIPTTKVVSRAVFVAAPADAFGMFGMERYFGFRHPFSRVFALHVPVFAGLL